MKPPPQPTKGEVLAELVQYEQRRPARHGGKVL